MTCRRQAEQLRELEGATNTERLRQPFTVLCACVLLLALWVTLCPLWLTLCPLWLTLSLTVLTPTVQ